MSRQGDIAATLAAAEEQLSTIELQYKAALREKEVPSKVPVLVKNYLENLRSPLDYIASEIAEITLGLSPGHHCYFPVACENRKAFEQHLKRNLPGLDTADPDLCKQLEDLQAYRPSGCKALPRLSKLVNENKHRRLTPQVRTENRGLKIDFPGGSSIQMGPGSSISGQGVISSGGGWISPGGGSISGDEPVMHGQNIRQTVEIWVGFEFSETGEDVLSLLRASLSDVRRVVALLTASLWPDGPAA